MHLQQPRADRAACTEWDVTWDAWQEARLAVRHALAHASHAVRHAASSARVRVVWCLQVHDMVRGSGFVAPFTPLPPPPTTLPPSPTPCVLTGSRKASSCVTSWPTQAVLESLRERESLEARLTELSVCAPGASCSWVLLPVPTAILLSET